MTQEDFCARVSDMVEWFAGLNPYEKQGSILQIEDVNFTPKTNTLNPLYCYAISAKRYALFNMNGDAPIIRKASAHGLGHLFAPYDGELPCPEAGVIGVKLWQHDVWQVILRAALDGRPNEIQYNHPSAPGLPAFQRYGATSPALLRWMKHYNDGKSYRERVKPFGFMMAPMARAGAFSGETREHIIDEVRRGAPTKHKPPKPITTFERDPSLAASQVFDRETGEPVPVDQLKTVAEALALYHVSTEDKFENGEPWDTGPTRRRHVEVTGMTLIGKEANKVGEVGEIDPVVGETLIIDI